MKEKHSSNFLIGLLFGVMVGAVIWYWQKSTSAEDGALALLDRLAKLQERLPVKSELLRPEPVRPAEQLAADGPGLQVVNGIGPVYEGRLNKAGVLSLGQLRALDAAELASILNINASRAESILGDARAK